MDGGWEVVGGGSEVEGGEVDGGLGVAELGGWDVLGGWEVSGGVAVDDIGVSVEEGGTEAGTDGEGDGVGIGEEVGGNSDGVGDDIGCDDAAVVALPVDVEGGLDKKSTMSLGGNKYRARLKYVQFRPGPGRRPTGRR